MLSLNIGNHIALLNLCTLLCINLNQFAPKICFDLYKPTPWCLKIAERIAFCIFLANKRFYSRCSLAFALELSEDVSLHRSNNSIGLCMLVGGKLFGRSA